MSTNRTKQVKADKSKPGLASLKRYWQSLDSSYRRSIVYALMLHAAVAILLGSGWSSKADVKPIVAPRHINAVVVDASAIDALKEKESDKKQKQLDKKKQQDEKLRKELEKKKALEKKAEQKKKSDAEKKKILAKKKALEKKNKEDAQKKALLKKKEEQKKIKEEKQREEKKKKAAEEKRIKEQKLKEEKLKEEKLKEQALQRERQEAQLQEMMLKAEQARQQELDDRLREQQIEADRQRQAQLKADQIAEMNEVDRFKALILAKITRSWHKPASAKEGMTVMLRFYLFPTGELNRVEIVKGSGSSVFDSSALSAAKAIDKYPVPSDNRVFENNFRKFNMLFVHQES